MYRRAAAVAGAIFCFYSFLPLCAQKPALDSGETSAAAGEPSGATAPTPVPTATTTLEVTATYQEMHPALAPVPQITGKEIMTSAGTYGDVSRFLQVLPGVVWSSDTSNDVLVRGGHPEENLFVIDGVEFPGISHISLSGSTGGFASMIDATAVSGMEMRPGVYDASYSSRLSSLIDIRTRQLDQEQRDRTMTLGVAGVGGIYQSTMPRGDYLFSAHRSILNLFTKDGGLDGVPIYSNALERVDLAASDRDQLTLLSLGGADTVLISPCIADSEVTSPYRTHYRGWRETAALTWKHTFNPKVVSDFVAADSLTRQKIGQQVESGIVTVNGYNTCQAAQLDTNYTENSQNQLPRLNYTLRANAGGWLFTMGASGQLQRLNDSVAQPIGQLSPFSASTTATDAVSFHRQFSYGQEAAFLQAEGVLGKRWNLMAGIRGEAFAIDASRVLEPRASILFRLNERQSLHASWNESAQLPPTMDMISYGINHRLPPIEARQSAAGMRIWQNGWGTLDAEGYIKQYRHEPVSTEFPRLMLFNMVDTLGQAFVWLPLTGSGTARSRGLEAVLRAHWGGHANLLLSATRAQASYRALDGVRRRGNYDTPVAINAMTSFHLPWGVMLNSRESYASGIVYTPFDVANSLAQNRGIYDLNRMNGLRGPYYNRLDVELERKFKISSGELNIHAGAENVLNRKNLMGYIWLQECGYAGCENSDGLPILKADQMQRYPIFSARFRF
jgi:hypothetical protein